MGVIAKAFYEAYKKRTFFLLSLILPPICMLSMKIAGYFLTTIQLLVGVAFIIACAVFIRDMIIRNPNFLAKKILKAFCNADQYEEFVSAVDIEMHGTDVKSKIIPRERIYIYMTTTWFVLVSPNGSLICKRCNIKKITSEFCETNSKFYLQITLDTKTFQFPYPELEDLLKEWCQSEEGI